MKLTPDKLGVFIKHTRRELGVTQRSLALTSGTGLRFIIELEKGKPTCQLGKALAVMNTLGISMNLSIPGNLRKAERPTSHATHDKTGKDAEGRS